MISTTLRLFVVLKGKYYCTKSLKSGWTHNVHLNLGLHWESKIVRNDGVHIDFFSRRRGSAIRYEDNTNTRKLWCWKFSTTPKFVQRLDTVNRLSWFKCNVSSVERSERALHEVCKNEVICFSEVPDKTLHTLRRVWVLTRYTNSDESLKLK